MYVTYRYPSEYHFNDFAGVIAMREEERHTLRDFAILAPIVIESQEDRCPPLPENTGN